MDAGNERASRHFFELFGEMVTQTYYTPKEIAEMRSWLQPKSDYQSVFRLAVPELFETL